MSPKELEAACVAASPAVAQRSTTRGFTVGAHLQGASLAVEEGDPDGGGGLGARVGYGFNRRFTGYFETDAIVFDVGNPDFGGYWSMVHVDVGVRFNFANSLRRWVPFLEGAIGARAVNVDDASVSGDSVGELNFSGGAFSLGGGTSFFCHREAGTRNHHEVQWRHLRAGRCRQSVGQQSGHRRELVPLQDRTRLVAVTGFCSIEIEPYA